MLLQRREQQVAHLGPDEVAVYGAHADGTPDLLDTVALVDESPSREPPIEVSVVLGSRVAPCPIDR